jgi:hypothetical protein
MVAIERDQEEGQDPGAEVTPSSLDEATHAELRVLYEDSSKAVRFAKERQWKLVGATLLLFAGIMTITEFLKMDEMMAKGLVLGSFVIGASAIYILIIYQLWQHTELNRLRSIGIRFSNVFAQIRGARPEREAKIHGFIILFMMIFGILLGNGAAAFFLSRLYL